MPIHRLKAEAQETLSPDVPAGVSEPHLKVLIVEDNDDSAETMAAVLRAVGHHVEVAPNGLAGLVMAAKFEPDAVLLDIGLPVIDGFQVAKSLREQRKENLVIIGITGYGQESVRGLAKQAGFDQLLVKPVDLESLLKILAGL